MKTLLLIAEISLILPIFIGWGVILHELITKTSQHE